MLCGKQNNTIRTKWKIPMYVVNITVASICRLPVSKIF